MRKLLTLKKRGEFLAAARARRSGTRGVLVQGRERDIDEGVEVGAVRVGFTCSKKVGNAVARNRAKRRLRALSREILPLRGNPGWDYVLIGRAEHTAKRPFDKLQRDLIRALDQLHKAAP